MLQQPETWVLLPTIGRQDRLTQVLKSIRDTAPMINITVAIEPDEVACLKIGLKFGANVVRIDKPRMGCGYAWNWALKHTPPTAKAFVLGADDLYFMPGWFEESTKVLHEVLNDSGLVGFNDLLKDPYWATHFLVTRDFLVEHMGGVIACPHYRTDYVDVETSDRAIAAGKFAKARNAFVKHNWIGRQPDKFFIESRPDRVKSKARYEARKAAGYPNDYQAVIR